MKNNIGLRTFQDDKLVVGKGYVYLPKEIIRDQYLTECLTGGKLSIMTEESGVLHDVYVDKLHLPYLKFPSTPDELGSLVIYITEVTHSQPIIVAILDKDEISYMEEDEWQIKKSYQGSVVEISGNAKNSLLHINVVSKQTNNPTFLVTVNGAGEKSGDMKIEIGRNLSIISDLLEVSSQKVSLYSRGEDSSSLFNLDNDSIEIDSEKILLNGGTNAMVLGTIFEDFFTKFITSLSQVTVNTSLGRMPLVEKKEIDRFKESIEDFLSTSVYVS